MSNQYDLSKEHRLAWAENAMQTAYPQDLADTSKVCSMGYTIQKSTKVLETEFACDAHMVSYVVYKDGKPLTTQPRLLKGRLHEVRSMGFQVLHQFLMADVDLIDHKMTMTAEKLQEVKAKIQSIPSVGWYSTRGGFRILRALKVALTPEQWEVDVHSFLAEIRSVFGEGWLVDPACEDWTRHFRLPYVYRVLKNGARVNTKETCCLDLTRMLPIDNTPPDVPMEQKREPRKVDPQAFQQLQDQGDHPASIALLERACEELAAAKPGTRHAQLIKWGYTVGGHVAAGGILYETAYQSCLDAISHYDGDKDAKKLADSIENGMSFPVDLSPRYESFKLDPRAAQELVDQADFEADYEGIKQEEEPTQKPQWDQILDRKQRSSEYKPTPLNVRKFLQHQPGWNKLVAFDEFQGDMVFTAKPKWGAIFSEAATTKAGDPWTDGDTTRLMMAMNSIGLDVSRNTVDSVLLEHAKANRTHAVRAYFETLKHDGIPRLDSWLTTYLGVESTPHSIKAGRWWMIQVVRRVMEPGSPAKYVLTLEGPQDIGKSTLLKKLAGIRWFHESKIDVGNKETPMTMQGRLILELPEGEILTRSSNEAMKQFIGQTHDTFCPKHSNRPVTIARQTTFAMTVNPGASGTYLTDQTGNSRYWPVVCTKAEIDAIEHDRDQLWAEAYAAYLSGEIPEPRSQEDKILFAEVVAERVHTDSWDLELLKSIPAHVCEITVGEALLYMNVEPKYQTKTLQISAGGVLKRAGWKNEGRQTRNGLKVTVYSREVLNLGADAGVEHDGNVYSMADHRVHGVSL